MIDESLIRCPFHTESALTHRSYTVGWICALQLEVAAAMTMLDAHHGTLPQNPRDINAYVLGRIGRHNVVIVALPAGEYGTNPAAAAVTNMQRSFESIEFCLIVGIGGGVPSPQNDIRLGDIVVSQPTAQDGGVIQYDRGRNEGGTQEENDQEGGRFVRTGSLNCPPPKIRAAISILQAKHHFSGSRKFVDYLSPAKNPYLPAIFTYPHGESDNLF